MSAPIQGRRVVDKHVYEYEPGEYGSRGPNWYGVTPNGLLCTLTRHSVVEHEDGTITVSPSIAVTGTVGESPDKVAWHGFLQRGIWSEA